MAQTHHPNLVGQSRVFLETVRLIGRVAQTDATVLIEGETGTGKELAARAIHYGGARRQHPFVPVNCGAIPESLVESEFFGHVRGAFTGATESRAGLITQARGGTLFLDEIEALAPRAQVALLRFLQDQEYRPVGGGLVREANVRIIAATNVALAGLCASGQYRKDLMFRLNVLKVELPALRDRGDDVVTLADLFLDRVSQQYGVPRKTIAPDAIRMLKRYPWPGNVRELESLVLRVCLLKDGAELTQEDFCTAGLASAASRNPPAIDTSEITALSFREAKARAVASFERAYIEELLARTLGNVSAAARVAGKERSRLARLIRKHGLRPAAFRQERAASS